MKKPRLLALVCILLLAACSTPGSPAAIHTPPVSSSTPAAVPKATVAATEATKISAAILSTAAPTNIAREPVHAILVGWMADQANWLARPVNPITLADLPGYAPIYVNYYSPNAAALSADGRQWAVITWPGDPVYGGGVLHLIDTITWQDTATPVMFNDYIRAMAFSPDGSRLAVAEIGDHASGGVEHLQADLRVIDTRQLSEVSTIELNPAISRMQFSPDGQRVVIYAVPHINCMPTGCVGTDAPQVMAFAVSSGKALWSLTLTGVRDGAYSEPTADDPQLVAYYTPGVSFSADGSRMYVIQAQQDQLTTIDLVGGAAQTVPITQSQSWLDQLMSFTAETAYAKGGNFGGADRRAVIAPDGQRIYVTGVQREVQRDASTASGFKEIDTVIEPQVIDLLSGSRLIAAENALAGTKGMDFVFSPDGHTLYLSRPGNAEVGMPGLLVVDPRTMKVVAQLAPGAGNLNVVFAPNGALTYFVNGAGSVTYIKAVNAASYQVVAARAVPGWVNLLVLPH